MAEVEFSKQRRNADGVTSKQVRGRQSYHHKQQVLKGQRGAGGSNSRPEKPGTFHTLRRQEAGAGGVVVPSRDEVYKCTFIYLIIPIALII